MRGFGPGKYEDKTPWSQGLEPRRAKKYLFNNVKYAIYSLNAMNEDHILKNNPSKSISIL